MFSIFDISELPSATWMGIATILGGVGGFFLKKQRIDDSHELNIVGKLMDRIDKVEASAEAAATAARAETAAVRKLHTKCVEESAELRILVAELRIDVQRLQERAS